MIGVLLAGFILMMAYPSLPDIDALATYQPKMPLRVFSADNVLIGEFGEERRSLVRYKDIPPVMKLDLQYSEIWMVVKYQDLLFYIAVINLD